MTVPTLCVGGVVGGLSMCVGGMRLESIMLARVGDGLKGLEGWRAPVEVAWREAKGVEARADES